jgi:hydrogenase small subunit
VHEGGDRAGYCEQDQFAKINDSPKYLVKLGCWSPAEKCNTPMRGDRLRLRGRGGSPRPR